jgi:hypothetical protein
VSARGHKIMYVTASYRLMPVTHSVDFALWIRIQHCTLLIHGKQHPQKNLINSTSLLTICTTVSSSSQSGVVIETLTWVVFKEKDDTVTGRGCSRRMFLALALALVLLLLVAVCRHAASTQNFHVDIVRVLAEHGANLNTPNARVCTPVYKAAYNGYKDIVKVLAEYGADINTPYNSNTSLFAAIRWNHTDVAIYLVNIGADINRAMERTPPPVKIVEVPRAVQLRDVPPVCSGTSYEQSYCLCEL